MSERQRVQQELVQFIGEHPSYNAPYGTIGKTRKLERGGYVRTITFGVARFLDAQILIFRPNHIVIHGEGKLGHYIEGTYRSLDEVKGALALLARERPESLSQ